MKSKQLFTDPVFGYSCIFTGAIGALAMALWGFVEDFEFMASLL